MSGQGIVVVLGAILVAAAVVDGAVRGWRSYTERLDAADDSLEFLGTVPPALERSR